MVGRPGRVDVVKLGGYDVPAPVLLGGGVAVAILAASRLLSGAGEEPLAEPTPAAPTDDLAGWDVGQFPALPPAGAVDSGGFTWWDDEAPPAAPPPLNNAQPPGTAPLSRVVTRPSGAIPPNAAGWAWFAAGSPVHDPVTLPWNGRYPVALRGARSMGLQGSRWVGGPQTGRVGSTTVSVRRISGSSGGFMAAWVPASSARVFPVTASSGQL